MKKVCLAIVLSFGLATPVLACPSMDGDAKTAKADKADKADKKKSDDKSAAQKNDQQKPADTTKKDGDKVSLK